MDAEQLADFDLFFFYGQNSLDLETQSDLMQLLVQPKRSLFYSREDGAALDDIVNEPNNTLLEVSARYEAASAIARRNLVVVDGTDGRPDRRVATSQAAIQIERTRESIEIGVIYLPFADHETQRTLSAVVRTG